MYEAVAVDVNLNPLAIVFVLNDHLAAHVLEGKVQNWDEWSAVENAAWSIPGVKRVEDRLAMAQARPGLARVAKHSRKPTR